MALQLTEITEGMSGKRVRQILNSNMQATVNEAAAEVEQLKYFKTTTELATNGEGSYFSAKYEFKAGHRYVVSIKSGAKNGNTTFLSKLQGSATYTQSIVYETPFIADSDYVCIYQNGITERPFTWEVTELVEIKESISENKTEIDGVKTDLISLSGSVSSAETAIANQSKKIESLDDDIEKLGIASPVISKDINGTTTSLTYQLLKDENDDYILVEKDKKYSLLVHGNGAQYAGNTDGASYAFLQIGLYDTEGKANKVLMSLTYPSVSVLNDYTYSFTSTYNGRLFVALRARTTDTANVECTFVNEDGIITNIENDIDDIKSDISSIEGIVEKTTETIVGTKSEGSYFSSTYNFVKGRKYIITIAEGVKAWPTSYICKGYVVDNKQTFEYGVEFTCEGEDYDNIYQKSITQRPFKWKVVERKCIDDELKAVESRVQKLEDGTSTNSGIVALNEPEETLLKFKQIKKVQYNNSGADTGIKQLVLLHFSDLHGITNNLNRICDYYNNYKSYIDDVIHTGDAIPMNWVDGNFDYWVNKSDAHKFLNCIGNHDTAYYTASEGFDWFRYVGTDAYNRYFSPFISSWGVVQPDNAANDGKCYYYKDYTSSNNRVNANVRLIVLDCMSITKSGGDAEQIAWFESMLADAKTNGLDVVVAYHYAKIQNAIECAFQNIYNDTLPNDIYSLLIDKVDAFINSGGKFVCWLTGHTHRDFFGTCTGSTYGNKMAVVVVDTAAAVSQPKFSDISRDVDTRGYDLFNIFAVDTYRKRFSVFRVGANYDAMTRHIGSICYDYQNQKLLSSF